MREYKSVDGLIVSSDKSLDWEGWQEVASAGPAPVKKKEEPVKAEKKPEKVAPKEKKKTEPAETPAKGAVIRPRKGK